MGVEQFALFFERVGLPSASLQDNAFFQRFYAGFDPDSLRRIQWSGLQAIIEAFVEPQNVPGQLEGTLRPSTERLVH